VVLGRALVTRGEPGWPWAVRFAHPSRAAVAALRSTRRRYQPPLALCAGTRALVLGLGTGSLFCAEAAHLFRELAVVDCKAVSAVNPVRQVYGTAHVGRAKGEALCEILARRLEPEAAWRASERSGVRFLEGERHRLAWSELRLRADGASVDRLRALLDELRPTLAIVAMGRTRDDNFVAAEELRRRGIRHITPSAFPGVSHFKHILTDGGEGPCYECLQGRLAVDGGAGPTLSPDEREMFYGGSQPATLAETYPSAHSLLRLAIDLALPRPARPVYLMRELASERTCFVGANRAERVARDGSWLYGCERPFALVTYGAQDVVGSSLRARCSCGRPLD
jgi:hypothetical protein